jgi:hypothetical protein
VKLPVFLLCLLSQLFFFAFARGETKAPAASLALADTQRQDALAEPEPEPAAPPAAPPSAEAARILVAQAVLAGDLDAFLPDLLELATWRTPRGGHARDATEAG